MAGSGGANQSDNISVIYAVLPTGGVSDPHYHNTIEEAFYITKGKGFVTINGKEIAISSGHYFLVAPGETHNLTNTGNEDLEYVAACTPPWSPEDSFSC